jgi:eukaryotic-like serine/threonine-protein kinase
MTPERWQQIKHVFNSALEHEPAQRASFLLRACENDTALRKEVESLLSAHEEDGSFIDSPAYKLAGADQPSTLRPGQQLGGYEITSFIGRGGMGEVYLAQDQRLRRKVALKLLPAVFMQDENRRQRFEQEARAASALNHPNIIVIYEISEVESTVMMVTEFIDGLTLRDHLTNLGALDLRTALNIAIQIADALDVAHKAGIVHRDIKPENIMIRPDGYVKVLDFGLAKLSEAEPPEASTSASNEAMRTGSGVVIGTIGYMSPEQARGQTVDARSDIFNLGAVIYEMVAGQKPFAGDTPSDTFAAILTTEPAPLSRVAPNTPAELARIVSKALRKDREERYQVVKDLLLDLRNLKEELDFQEKLDRSGTHSMNIGLTRRNGSPVVTIALIAALLGIAGIVVYKFLDWKRTPTSGATKVLKTTQITFSSGLDGFPSLSPDGKSVTYTSDQNGSFEIYVKQLASGGGELQLTNDGQQNFGPAWSPDGQRIAYYSKKRGGIWTVSALGGAPRQLTETGASPAWSPDGSLIAYQSAVPGEVFSSRALSPSTIWIVSAQGGKPRRISEPGNPSGGHGAPAWSPDGKRIAFEVADYLSVAVWSIAVDGTDPKKIVDGSEPTYSSDGGRIYFNSGHRAESELSRISVSATGDPVGAPAVVMQPGNGVTLGSLAMSADGKRILYSVERTSSNLWTIAVTPKGDAAPPTVFVSDTSSRNSLPRFSPDGTKIAINRWRPAMSVDLWVADANGKNLTQLTNNPGMDSQASWLPGGDKLAFLSDRDNRHLMLWSISIATGKQEPLLDLGDGVQFAAVSPDGNLVAYNLIQNGIMNIWLAGIHDGQRRQLTFDNEMSGFPCWSPDGNLLAFEMKRGEDDYLMLLPLNGGPATQLTFDKGKSWPNSFSPDGDKIVFAGQRDGVWNIYSISLATKEQKRLTNYSRPNSFVRYPSWTRNQIVYEYAETTGNLWLMELE